MVVIKSLDTDAERITQTEKENLRERAEHAGQAHWFPGAIKTEGELTQAQIATNGTRLLDVFLGEGVFEASSAREACDRGEISTVGANRNMKAREQALRQWRHPSNPT